MRCACAVQKIWLVFPSPMANATAVTMCRDKGLPQIPTEPKNSDNEVQQTMFHIDNATTL